MRSPYWSIETVKFAKLLILHASPMYYYKIQFVKASSPAFKFLCDFWNVKVHRNVLWYIQSEKQVTSMYGLKISRAHSTGINALL